eukprot:COSAG06_NODE_7119_length_2625_cov_1.685669_2_plen_103_part_00
MPRHDSGTNVNWKKSIEQRTGRFHRTKVHGHAKDVITQFVNGEQVPQNDHLSFTLWFTLWFTLSRFHAFTMTADHLSRQDQDKTERKNIENSRLCPEPVLVN